MDPSASTDQGGTTARLSAMPGPRWNRQRAIYPSHLHAWLECPRRCRLQYVDRVPFEAPWNRKIEVGNALHKVMEEIANVMRQTAPLPAIDSWRPRIERLLPITPYEAETDLTLADREGDIDNVLRWACEAQEYITDAAGTIIRIEKYYPRDWQDAELGPMKLGAKADQVIKRHDADGAYIEIVDYKTGGWKRPVDFAPALARISHKPQIHAALAVNGFPRVRFTYLWLPTRRCSVSR